MKQAKTILNAGYPNPLHPDNETEYKRRLKRNRGNHDITFKEWREDTHPAFQGMFDPVDRGEANLFPNS